MIRRLLALAFLLLAVFLTVRLSESLSSAEELRRALDDARRVGLLGVGSGGTPTAPDPSVEAAMRRYVAACALMPDEGIIHFAWLPADASLPGLAPSLVATPDQLAEAVSALDAFGEALELVRRGARTGYAWAESEAARDTNPRRLHLALSSLVALLRARCHVAAARGDADEALRSCAEGLRLLDLGRSLRSLRVQSWRLTSVATLAATAAWVASSLRPSVRACREALGALQGAALVEPLGAAIRSETLDDLRQRLSPEGQAGSLRGWAAAPWGRRGVAAYVDHMSRGYQALERVMGSRDAGRSWAADAERLGTSFYVGGALSPLVGSAVVVDLALLTVAGRLAADEGEPAACLDDLSQTLVPSTRRVDPWSGEPYRWGTGPWAVYSVGPDGRDDGGDPTRDVTVARVR